MAFSTTTRNAALDAVGTQGAWISLHTADPGTTGASEASGGTYARVQTTWSPASGGSKPGSQVTINVPAGTYTYFGVWSAASGGTFSFGSPLNPPSQTFASAGTYGFTPSVTD